MSARPALGAPILGAPAVVRSTSLDFSHHRSFLGDVVIDKGPRDLLGRLMLKVDTDLREKGVVVSFATFEELVAVNKANAASWSPLLPLFDPAESDVGRVHNPPLPMNLTLLRNVRSHAGPSSPRAKAESMRTNAVLYHPTRPPVKAWGWLYFPFFSRRSSWTPPRTPARPRPFGACSARSRRATTS